MTADDLEMVWIDERSILHHVAISLVRRNAVFHNSVSTGDQRSGVAIIKIYPTKVLRVAVVAVRQARPELSAVLDENLYLLLLTVEIKSLQKVVLDRRVYRRS